jgi:hypothetical protein
MSWDRPHYSRFEQHPEETDFSQSSELSQHVTTQTEQKWTHQVPPARNCGSRSIFTLLCEWKCEIATWLLGSLAFGSTVGLLITYHNRPLSDWKSNIRPAPVVATLSQVAQSAFLYSVSACIGQLKWYAVSVHTSTIKYT